MTAGERGPTGDHGQAGEPGLTGATGAKGDKGERYSSWLTRNVVKAYVILLTGVLLSIVLTAYTAEKNSERLKKAFAVFERESVETDRAFCDLTNRTFTEINKNRQAARDAYGLLVPAPGSSAAAAERLDRFREQLLATIDGDLPQLDCSGIGNGIVDFSLQDAIRNNTIATPTTTTIPN